MSKERETNFRSSFFFFQKSLKDVFLEYAEVWGDWCRGSSLSSRRKRVLGARVVAGGLREFGLREEGLTLFFLFSIGQL